MHSIRLILLKRRNTMAKPNFQFQKRQKELERKKKNEEKLQRKLARSSDSAADESADNAEEPPAEEITP
jgi:septal ring factor EnvC (AmiA/AmiB activator)